MHCFEKVINNYHSAPTEPFFMLITSYKEKREAQLLWGTQIRQAVAVENTII